MCYIREIGESVSVKIYLDLSGFDSSCILFVSPTACDELGGGGQSNLGNDVILIVTVVATTPYYWGTLAARSFGDWPTD